MVAGVLTYIVQIPPAESDRPHPASSTFTPALQQQQAAGPIKIPATPAVQTTIPATPATSPSAPLPSTALPSAPTLPGTAISPSTQASVASDNLKALLLVGLGTGAAILTYRYVNRKRAS